MEDRDKRLVEKYFSRDESALAETAEHYGRRLHGLAKSFLGDTRDIEECVNDTYLKAWGSIPPHKPEDMFSYLARLCRCTAYNIIEKQQAAKRSAQLVELTSEMEECIPDSTAESITAESEITDMINDFLGTLRQDNCDIFVKRYWFGASVESIAEDMGCSVSKVKTTLHRTRKKLKSYLEQRGVHL